jgi:hypothetical protein
MAQARYAQTDDFATFYHGFGWPDTLRGVRVTLQNRALAGLEKRVLLAAADRLTARNDP